MKNILLNCLNKTTRRPIIAAALVASIFNVNGPAKASIPIFEIMEGMRIGVEIAKILKPVVKPITEEISYVTIGAAKMVFAKIKAKRDARRQIENTYISPVRMVHEMDETAKDELLARYRAYAKRHDVDFKDDIMGVY